MKIVFVSDIHGVPANLDCVLKFYDSVNADMLCIVGDIINYGPRNGVPQGLDPMGVVNLLSPRSASIVAVRGNCDSEVDQMLLPFPILSDYAVVTDGARRFLLTHGHLPIASQPWLSADVVVTGHTHLWTLKPEGNALSLNTGSITFPKQGNQPTFAYYDGQSLSVRNLSGEVLASHIF